MKYLALVLALAIGALCACGGTDTSAGARGDCAEGGALNGGTCAAEPATPEGACTYLVECGAIPIQTDKNNVFSWSQCVEYIEGTDEYGEPLIIDCIEASSCDALVVPGSPEAPDTSKMACLHLGAG